MNKGPLNKILYSAMLTMPEDVFFNFISEYITQNYSDELQIQAGTIIDDLKNLLIKEN